MIRQWQEMYFEKPFSRRFPIPGPDYVTLAKAYGVRGHAGHGNWKMYCPHCAGPGPTTDPS